MAGEEVLLVERAMMQMVYELNDRLARSRSSSSSSECESKLDYAITKEWIDELDQRLKSTGAAHSPDLVGRCLEKRCIWHSLTKGICLAATDAHEDDDLCRITLVHQIILDSSIELLAYLLENFHFSLEVEADLGLNKNEPLTRGVAPLWLAVYSGKMEFVTKLLEHGADVNHTSSNRTSPVRVAINDNNLDILKILIAHGADLNLSNFYNSTPLMLAAYEKNPKAVEVLLKSGADPNLQALCGSTALHFAAEHNHLDIIKLLLDNDAKIMTSKCGFTPITLAAKRGINPRVILKHPKVSVPLIDRIEAFELYASSLCLKHLLRISEEQESTLLTMAAKVMVKAFKMRYSRLDAQSLASCKVHTVEAPHELPEIAKDNLVDQLPEYRMYQECLTLSEFFTICRDPVRMIYEAMLIMERYWGAHSLALADNINLCGALLIDAYNDFVSAVLLFKRALEIKLELRIFIGPDLRRLYNALVIVLSDHASLLHLLPTFMEDLLQYAVQYFELQPKPFGYQALAYQLNVGDLIQIAKFTMNDLRITVPSEACSCSTEVNHDSNEIFTTIILILISFVQYAHLFPEENQMKFRKVLKKLLRLEVTEHPNGFTITHYVLNALGRDTNPPRPPVQLCNYEKLIETLLSCSVSLNHYDMFFNTPLHYCAANLRVHLTVMHRILSSMSAHQHQGTYQRGLTFPYHYADLNVVHDDAVNIFNQTIYDCGTLLEQDILRHGKTRVTSLRCLAARVAHYRYLRCVECRYYELYDLDQHRLLFKANFGKPPREEEAANRGATVGSMPSLGLRYRFKDKYHEHKPVPIDIDHAWAVMCHLTHQLKIPLPLLQFIELHGPCKFIHYTLPDGSGKCLKAKT